MVDSLEKKNSPCVAVMFSCICLQVNNKYSDAPMARHTNTKSEFVAIILFLLTVFSVFMKTCNGFSPAFSGQTKN